MNSLSKPLSLILPFIIIIPFIIISFYNHPALDDWWYAEVFKQYGFAGAQHYWYTHYTARFFSTFLLTLEPLCFNWIEGHKLLPVIFIAALFATCKFFSHVFLQDYKQHKLIIPLWLTASYLLIQRDYFECLYWLAANVVYQYTMLYFLLHVALIYQLFFANQANKFKQFSAIFFAVAIVGSNETLGGLVLAESFLILFLSYRIRRFKSFSFLLLLAVITSWVVMFLARGNWDKIEVATGEHVYTFNFYLAVKHSIISCGYYSFFLLKQPFFWCLALLSIPFINRFIDKYFSIKKPLQLLVLSAGSFTIAFTIYFISIFPTGILIPPLRVTNIAMPFLFFGLAIFILGPITQFISQIKLEKIILKNRLLLMSTSVIFAIVLPTKFNQLLTDITSGRARGYNNAMYNRYRTIKAYDGKDTLKIPGLKNVPRTIVATDISGPVSENMALVFDKKFTVKITSD